MVDARDLLEAGRHCVVAIDQGTSSTKAIAVDGHGTVRASAHRPISQAHPAPGHVEQDATEIATSVSEAIDEVTSVIGDACTVVAVGISSQRESAVVWDRATGTPLGPLLGWQDRRTSAAADALRRDGTDTEIRRRTGLPLDPMFSALKLSWLLDAADPSRQRATAGEIAVGTVDSWLVATLTGEHQIEAGNASRTQLMNLGTVAWDDALLELFNIPRATLPTIERSDHRSAPIRSGRLAGTPITGVLGDSHAALFAHGLRTPGAVKATYGTGSSIMGLVDDLAALGEGVVGTVAWQTNATAYAGEGNILSTGATMVWLASLLDIEPAELFELAESNDESHTIDLVPAFAGLGAPWWDPGAVATLTGFDLGTSRRALAESCGDSIALQIEDVAAVFDSSGIRVEEMLVDGGPSRNDWLMQRQADLSQRRVTRRTESGLSALGAAHLAGASVGLFDADRPLSAAAHTSTFPPRLDPETARVRRERWHRAVARSRVPLDATSTPTERSTTARESQPPTEAPHTETPHTETPHTETPHTETRMTR
jgi:glycerol kinase